MVLQLFMQGLGSRQDGGQIIQLVALALLDPEKTAQHSTLAQRQKGPGLESHSLNLTVLEV